MTRAVDAAAGRAGWLWALTAVTIWAGWFAATAHGVRGSFAPVDVALVRVAVPTVVLALPLWVARHRLAAALRPSDVLGLALYGLPFVAAVAVGLAHAPVSHAVALVPGLVPVLAGLWAVFADGARPPPRRWFGFALLVAGAVLVVTAGGGEPLGHACLLAASLCLAVFTVTVRRLGLPPFVATGVVAAVSAVILAPAYLLWPIGRLAAAPWGELGLQVVVQGVATGLVATYAYARAIGLLGAAVAAATVALVPPMATLIGWLALGERPGVVEAVAVALAAAGVFAAADVRLKRRARGETAGTGSGRSAA